jgi:hypothetical protein
MKRGGAGQEQENQGQGSLSDYDISDSEPKAGIGKLLSGKELVAM